MATLRLASGWSGGGDAERMRRYLAGEHHPQEGLGPRAAFVAEAAGEMIGFIAGHRTTRLGCAGELQWMLVAPSHRGGAAAAGLFLEIASWFVRQNARRVCVNVAPENVRARRFYERHGATVLSDYWMIWTDIGADRRDGIRRVSAALREHWDPIGVGQIPDLPENEYDSYAPQVLSMFREGADDLAVAAYLSEVERTSMGLRSRMPAQLVPAVRSIRRAAWDS